MRECLAACIRQRKRSQEFGMGWARQHSSGMELAEGLVHVLTREGSAENLALGARH